MIIMTIVTWHFFRCFSSKPKSLDIQKPTSINVKSNDWLHRPPSTWRVAFTTEVYLAFQAAFQLEIHSEKMVDGCFVEQMLWKTHRIYMFHTFPKYGDVPESNMVDGQLQEIESIPVLSQLRLCKN